MQKNKHKGNLFENEVANKLSKWIMDKENYFQRSITSGALKNEKSAYNGDIIPVRFNEFNWNYFPFLIETKNGYPIQTIANFSLIEQWLVKLLQERTIEQTIILLIINNEKNNQLFITNQELTLVSPINININYQNIINKFYVYKFKDVIKYKFDSLYSDVFLNKFKK
jgi:hypothetical protein